jgi:hypothetical protein
MKGILDSKLQCNPRIRQASQLNWQLNLQVCHLVLQTAKYRVLAYSIVERRVARTMESLRTIV